MDYKQYFDGKTQSLSTTQYVNDMDIKMAIYIYVARMYIMLGEWLNDEKSDVRWGAAGFWYGIFIQQLHGKSLWIILLCYEMI